ncbi:hypothetical protein BU15DRAFT_65453 [Melanogaster broomeanus]|nr:hypothetical protein BU15DRAFT_65453 [Melanogaster broomeanus]
MSQYPWPENGDICGGAETFNTPWVGPPAPHQILTFHTPTFDGFPWDPALIHDENDDDKRIRLKREQAAKRIIKSERQKEQCSKFWESFKDLFRNEDRKKAKKLSPLTMPVVPVERWKAYGCWGSPIECGIQGHNATPRPIPPITIDSDNAWNSLRSPNNSLIPVNGHARLQYPALPSPLQEWSTPQAGALSLVPPLDVQLNPFLQHRYIGPYPICFDIGLHPSGIVYDSPESEVLPLAPTVFAQPATTPSITHMTIIGVADDPLPYFPWPISIYNTQGITCGDVFTAISNNFQEHVAVVEYNNWTVRQREVAARAYYRRISIPLDLRRPDELPNPGDGLRRIDYMANKVMFRGLEASPLRNGQWLMFLGPP